MEMILIIFRFKYFPEPLKTSWVQETALLVSNRLHSPGNFALCLAQMGSSEIFDERINN